LDRGGSLIFIDRAIPVAVVEALHKVGAVGFTFLEYHFPPDHPDEMWIPNIGERGWIAVTRDKNIRRKRRQRDLVAASKLRLFVFNQRQQMNRLDYLEAILRNWRRMLHFSAENEAPALITISKDGEFTNIL
jgi:PIN domain-containing protein